MFLELSLVVGIAYLVIIASKLITTIEFRQKTYLLDYIGTFFAFLYFPVGVWTIQKKVKNFIKHGYV